MAFARNYPNGFHEGAPFWAKVSFVPVFALVPKYPFPGHRFYRRFYCGVVRVYSA